MYDKVKLALELCGLLHYLDKFIEIRLDDQKVNSKLDDPGLHQILYGIFLAQSDETKFKTAFRKLASKAPEPVPDYEYDMPRSAKPQVGQLATRHMPQSRVALKRIFDQVDEDKSGRISVNELYKAIKLGGADASLDTCRLMIGLFDQGHGTIDLLGFFCVTMLLGEWVQSFLVFDIDSTGYIDRNELMGPLRVVAKGYRLEEKFVDLIVKKFGPKKQSFPGGLHLEGFLNACAFICNYSNGFREKDLQSSGFISYHDFLTITINAWN